MLNRHRDIAHLLTEFVTQPVQGRAHHLLETAGLDLDHLPIVHRPAAPAATAPSLSTPAAPHAACEHVRPHRFHA
jgi:hypothetical protein